MGINYLKTNKKFSAFFWTQFWGAFNDNFFKNALVVLVTFRGVKLMGLDSASLVAIASGLLILPFFLFSPFAGQLSDKFEKSQIIRATKIWEILIMLIAALGFLMNSYMLLMLLIFLMGTQSTFFGPVKYSIIPELVGEDNITKGNALVEMGTFFSILLGTIAGGLATGLAGADYIIAAGVIIFALFGYLSARKVPKVQAGDPKLKIQWNIFPEYVSLWRIIREKQIIFLSVITISWFWFFGAGILSVLPVYVKTGLKGNENVVTLFLALFTVGIGTGSMLCERLSKGKIELGMVPIGALGLSIFSLDLFFTGTHWLNFEEGSVSFPLFVSQLQSWRVMFDFMMMSVSGGLFIVPLYSLLQQQSRIESRSRVIAGTNIINALFMVVASLLLLYFYSLKLQPVEILGVFAVMNFIFCSLIFFKNPEFIQSAKVWLRDKSPTS